MVETILVTGATRNAGNEVIKQLLAPAFSSSGHNRIKAAFHSQNKVDKLKRVVKKLKLLTSITIKHRLLLML
jgi:hypothetical protein